MRGREGYLCPFPCGQISNEGSDAGKPGPRAGYQLRIIEIPLPLALPYARELSGSLRKHLFDILGRRVYIVDLDYRFGHPPDNHLTVGVLCAEGLGLTRGEAPFLYKQPLVAFRDETLREHLVYFTQSLGPLFISLDDIGHAAYFLSDLLGYVSLSPGIFAEVEGNFLFDN